VSRPPASIKPLGWYADDPTSLPTALVAAVPASASLLQARLIELGLPINVAVGMRF
jgi:hypothetical protein